MIKKTWKKYMNWGLFSYLSAILFKICNMAAFCFCIMVSNSCCIFAWRSALSCWALIFPLRKPRVSLPLLLDFLVTDSVFYPAFRLLVSPSFSQPFRLISSPISRSESAFSLLLQPRSLASASSHFSVISSIRISISLSLMSTSLSFAWCFRFALNLSQ